MRALVYSCNSANLRTNIDECQFTNFILLKLAKFILSSPVLRFTPIKLPCVLMERDIV